MDSFNKALAAEHSIFVNPIRGLMVWDADVRAEKRDLARHDRELGVKLQQALQEHPAEHTIADRAFCLRSRKLHALPELYLSCHPVLKPGTCKHFQHSCLLQRESGQCWLGKRGAALLAVTYP